MKVLARLQRNNSRNNAATVPKTPRNQAADFRAQKLRSLANEVIDVAIQNDIKPEIGLGFFNTLDWEQFVDGELNVTDIGKCLAYAKSIHEMHRSGLHLVEIKNLRNE